MSITDAHQDKAFEARDKGKAEHVKKVLQKSNYGSHENGGSYDGHSQHSNDDDHVPPPPPPSSYTSHHSYNNHDQPSVTDDSPEDEPKQLYHDAASSNSNNRIKLKVNATSSSTGRNYLQGSTSSIPKSIVAHVDPPASVTFLNYQTSASKPVPSVVSMESTTEIQAAASQRDSEIREPQTTLPPTTTVATFVEIVANVTSLSHDAAPATTTIEPSKSSVSTSSPEVVFRPLRKPPSPFINALHIIDSPSTLNVSASKTIETVTTAPISMDKSSNSTYGNLVTPSYSNHHKFSKLVSIEAPPSVYLEALNRMKEAKAKAEKEAKEKKEREKVAWLSRLVKANAYGSQPLLNVYLPYASSSNGYGQYILPNSNSLSSSSSLNKGSYASGSQGDAMAALTSLLGSSSSSSQVSSIMKNLSPLTSFTPYGLYPFASGSSNSLSSGSRKSPLKRLASTLNPRKILPSVREYTKSLTQPLTNVLSPYASASNVRNTILPLNGFQNSKTRLFPVTSNSDPSINSILSLLMNHAKRMDSNSNEDLIGSHEIDPLEKEKKISSLLDSTFASLVKEYPPVTSPSIDAWISTDASIEKDVKVSSSQNAERREDSDDEDEYLNTSVPSFVANDLSDPGQEESIDWGPQTNLKNAVTKTTLNEDHPKTGESHSVSNVRAQGIINHSGKFSHSSTRPSSPVSSLKEWVKQHEIDMTALKPLNNVFGARERRGSSIPLNHPSLPSQFIENSTSQPVYLKNTASSTSLADAFRQSKWIAQTIHTW